MFALACRHRIHIDEDRIRTDRQSFGNADSVFDSASRDQVAVNAGLIEVPNAGCSSIRKGRSQRHVNAEFGA